MRVGELARVIEEVCGCVREKDIECVWIVIERFRVCDYERESKSR